MFWFLANYSSHDVFAGGTLAEYIQKRCNSLLDEETILHFFVQILLALYHVHNKLILHRDLKTQNILLDKHQMIVKIGDFGISKILVSKSKAYTVGQTSFEATSTICFYFIFFFNMLNLATKPLHSISCRSWGRHATFPQSCAKESRTTKRVTSGPWAVCSMSWQALKEPLRPLYVKHLTTCFFFKLTRFQYCR